MNKDVSKAIYKELRNRVINIPPAQEKYGCPFFNDTLIGQKSIACLILSPRTQCCVNFNSNYLTDDLVTNAFLYERGVVLCPLCSFCGKENESLEHLLIYCNYAKEFWAEVIKWLCTINVCLSDGIKLFLVL